MKKLIFRNGRCSGFVEGNYNSENVETREVSESELNKLIPDSFEETDWKEVRRHYKLVDGEVVFDEDYESETEEQ